MRFGDSAGGPLIFDTHSGALSKGKKFVNLFSRLGSEIAHVFNKDDVEVFHQVVQRLKQKIRVDFQVDGSSLYLTAPVFFANISSREAHTPNDEYWHDHVDRVAYGSFDYTALVYLSDYGLQFQGGEFVFVDSPSKQYTVQPRKGRVVYFTSGAENTHRVNRVTDGNRLALTVPFTCREKHSITLPLSTQ